MGSYLDYAKKRRNGGEALASSNSAVSSKGNYGKYATEKRIGVDTLETDLTNMNTRLVDATSGWQTPETMANLRTSVEDMYKRTTAYQDYASKYAPDAKNNIGAINNAYKNTLNNWDALASTYGMYKDADSYTKETTKLRELYSMTKDDLASHLKDENSIAYTTYGGQDITWKSLYDEKLHSEMATSKEGAEGWKKFLADESTQKEEKKKEAEGKKWYEWLGETLGGVSDTTLPSANLSQVVSDKREDTSYMKPTDDWTQEEQNIFGAYYLDDPEKAYEYATNLNNSKAKAKEEGQKQAITDSATSGFWAGAGHTLGSIASAPLGLADYLDDLTSTVAGRPIMSDGLVSPFEYSQTVQGGISNKLNEMSGTIDESVPILGGKGLGDVYGVGTGIAQSALSAYALGGAGTMISYFGQGASAGVDDALSRGATDEQALLYGALVGAGEGISEKIGVDNLFKLGSSNTLKGMLKNVLKQAGAEGIEEGVSSVISEISDRVVMQDKSVFENAVRTYTSQGMTPEEAKKKAWSDVFNDVAFDTLAGAVSGGVHAGIQTPVQTYTENRNAGKTVRENEATDDLKNLASELGGDSYLKYIELLDSGKMKDAQLGKFFGEVESEVRSNYNSERDNAVMRPIAEMANELGDSKNSGLIASAIQKQIDGQKLTSEEKAVLKTETAQGVLENIRKNGGVYVNPSSSFDTALNNVKRTEKIATPKTADEQARQQTLKALNKGEKTVDANGNEVTIEGIKTENGATTLLTSQGEVSADEMTFSSNDAEIVSYAQSMSEEKANVFLAQYDGKTDAEYYAQSFEHAYMLGEGKIDLNEALSNRGALTEAQVLKVYEAGNRGRVIARQKAVDAINKKYSSKVVAKGKFDDSIIDYNGTDANKVNWNNLTAKQKNAVTFVKAFSEATGVNVQLIKSKVQNGKHKGENGRYDHSTNTIYIDVYAGRIDAGSLNDAIIPTVSHEVTHWMKAKSPAMYAKMQDLILDTLAQDGRISVNDLIAKEKANMKKNHPNMKVTDESAIDELVARGSEDMLANSDKVRKMLATMSKTEQDSFIAKVKETFQNIMDWVNDLLKQYRSESAEAVVLRQYKDRMKELSKMWDETLAEAVKTNQSMQAEGIATVEQVIEAEQFSAREYEKPITMEDVNVLRSIGRKSVNDFTGADIKKAEKWAYKFYKELGVKSPFFRAWFGDWRMHDKAPVEIITMDTNAVFKSGNAINTDTGEKLSWNGEMQKESKLNASKDNKADIEIIVANIQRIVENGILLDTTVSTKTSNRKLEGTSWMHSFYSLAQIGDRVILIKLYAENAFSEKQNLSFTRAYELKHIKKIAEFDGGVLIRKDGLTESHSTISINSVADLFEIVKGNDKEFHPKAVNSAMLNEDGTPKAVYHGTNADFEVFDISKNKVITFGNGFYFGENKKLVSEFYAKNNGRVIEAYLNIKNPFVINQDELTDIDSVGSVVGKRLGVDNVTKETIMDALKSHGYDGVHYTRKDAGNDVWVAYESTQIKSTDNIGTFNNEDANIQYSDREITPITEEDYSTLKEFFGTTKNYKVAGYLLKDGAMLDFSGRHWGNPSADSRDVDHRDVWDAWEHDDRDGTDEMVNMIGNGNIRLMPETGGINLAVRPTEQQIETLKKYIDHFKGEIIVDFDKAGGDTVESYTYNRGTSADRIIDEINTYFRGGRRSELAQFLQYSDRDSKGNQLTEAQVEFFKDSKIRNKKGNLLVVYHGTNNNFNTFKRGDVGYHFGNKTTARTRVGYGKNTILKEVYLNITNPIVFDEDLGSWDADHRLTKELVNRGIITEEEFYNVLLTDDKKYRRSTERSNSKLREVLLSKGYDGIVYSNTFESNGSDSYIAFKSSQIKEIANTNPTSDADIRYSDRDNVSVYELMGETERLQKANAELQADVARLKERLKIEKQLTKGNTFDEKKLESVARYLLRSSKSNYSMDMLVDGLRDVYSYIVESRQIDWDDLYAKAYDVARNVLAEQREQRVENDYFKMILDDIRKTKIRLSEQQIAEAKHIFGNDYHKRFFGRITLTDKGIDLDSKWQEWSAMYPDIFDAEITPADQVTALYDIYDSVRDSAIAYQKYNDEESIRALATEIYNQYWNISTIRTTADKYDKEIKKLNFEHRSAMKRMRDTYNESVEKQKLADRIHYGKIINDVRNRKEREVQRAKELGKQRVDAIKERAEINAKIQKITKNALTLNDWLVKNNKDKHIPEPMKEATVQLINAIDFSSKQMLGGGQNPYQPTNKDLRLSKALSNLHEVANDMKKQEAEAKADESIYMDIDLPDFVVESLVNLKKIVDNLADRFGNENYVLNQMSLDELSELDSVISTLKTAIATANKTFVLGQNEMRSSIANQLIANVDALSEKKMDNVATNFLEYSNTTPYYMLKRLGPVGERIFNVLMDAQENLVFLEDEIVKFVEGTVDGKKIKEWSNEIREFKVVDMKRSTEDNPKYKVVKMTTAQVMSMYALNKRESAKLHLAGGGIRVTDIELSPLKKIMDAEGTSLAPSELETILNSLTTEQKQVADALQKFMSEKGADWGNKVTMARWGINQFGEENYFPMDTVAQDGNLDNVGQKDNSIYRLLNMSFTKSLTPNANNQLVIDNIFDVFARHMTDMAKYSSFALPLLDTMKILGYSQKQYLDEERVRHNTISVASSIKRAFGKGGYSYIINLLKDLNGAEVTPRDEAITKKLMSNYKISAVGGNLRVAMLQGTAFIKAGLVLDAKYLTKALATNGLEGSKKAMKHSGMALWKSKGHYDLNISRSVASEIKQDKSAVEKFREASLKGAEIGDKITWGYLWNASELWARDNTTYKYGSEEFNQAVSNKLREIIVKTQVVDSTLTRSQMMRSKSAMVQTLTAFMSESTMTYNMLSDAFFEWSLDARKEGNSYKSTLSRHGRKFATTMGVYTLTAFTTALAGALVDAGRDDDEEKEFGEKYLEAFLESLGDNLNVFSSLPIIKDIVSIAQGYSPSRFDEQSFVNIFSGIRKWMKVAEGEGNVYSATYKTLQGLSQLTGLPASNMVRDAVTMWNLTIGEVYPSLKIKQK